ncbi:MAG: hypothetical protein WC399_05080 [Bacilli bacterium]|jgi:hypothetical protein
MKKLITVIVSFSAIVFTLIAGIATTGAKARNPLETQSYDDDTIRVYLTMKDSISNGFYKQANPTLKIYAWGKDASDNVTTEAFPGSECTKLLTGYAGDGTSNYGNALFYIDLPADTTKVQFFNELYFLENKWDRTVTINIGSYYDGSVYVGSGQLAEPSNPENEYVVGMFYTLAFTVAEFGSLIDGCDACSDSEINGYNAVPYIDYYYASYATINNTVTLTEPGYGENAGSDISVGVQAKWEAMVARYQSAHSK